MDQLGLAFELLGVGMITVFVILALVVVLGNGIIIFVNKFIGEEAKAPAVDSSNHVVAINPKKLAAIISAVSNVTKGAGRVTNVEKQ